MGKKNCFDIERFKKGPSVIKTCLLVTDEPSYKRVSGLGCSDDALDQTWC